MARVLTSPWFLAWTAACFAVAVGFTTWLGEGSSTTVRVLCILLGVLAASFVMLLIAWAAVEQHGEVEPAAEELPRAADPPPLRPQVEGRLTAGEALAGSPRTEDVDAWIAETHALLARERPGLAGYFGALATREYDDEAERLGAYLARLRTIVREFAA
ncbi:MAG TPA: hypothetical protein VI408_06460 [Gaiellaceae bacterium]